MPLGFGVSAAAAVPVAVQLLVPLPSARVPGQRPAGHGGGPGGHRLLAWFLNRTTSASPCRLQRERDRASLLGVPVGGSTRLVGRRRPLATVALILRAGVVGLPIGTALGFSFLLRTLAAARSGGWSGMPTIVVAPLPSAWSSKRSCGIRATPTCGPRVDVRLDHGRVRSAALGLPARQPCRGKLVVHMDSDARGPADPTRAEKPPRSRMDEARPRRCHRLDRARVALMGRRGAAPISRCS